MTFRNAIFAAASGLVIMGSLGAGISFSLAAQPPHRPMMGHPGPGMGTAGTPMMGMMSPEMRDEMFDRLDTDGNGELSKEELAEAAQARADRRAAMDADGDGRVSREERHAFRQREMQERRSQAFAAMDADDDGSVGLAEFQARASERAAERFQRMDRDANGVLSEDEMVPMRPRFGMNRH